ncbi:MAG: class 1 fructose-bisphosphatase [Nitrospirae bacterium]|nr:MAG: class 1 fructose-bisphosphatase [Nitrospirota bacterium]
MNRKAFTLARFITETQAGYPAATGEFSALLVQIGLAGKILTRDLRRAGLLDILGATGETNVQGEAVKKLDTIANETLIKVFQHTGLVCALASEEMEKPLFLSENWPHGKYMLLFDPLDGSSNTDVNMPMGTIFSVLHYEGAAGPAAEDLVRGGTQQVAAGYLMYGSSTVLVFTSGKGAHEFTLDPDLGEYLLSKEGIRMPMKGAVYSANEGNACKWVPGVRRFIDYLKEADKPTARPYTLRYSGCLVADVHRLLTGGGIYLYPAETNKPEGKLRLLYEANPLAMVVEQAGGRASTGVERILAITPEALHQRVPLLIGSGDDVAMAEAFIQGKR